MVQNSFWNSSLSLKCPGPDSRAAHTTLNKSHYQQRVLDQFEARSTAQEQIWNGQSVITRFTLFFVISPKHPGSRSHKSKPNKYSINSDLKAKVTFIFKEKEEDHFRFSFLKTKLLSKSTWPLKAAQNLGVMIDWLCLKNQLWLSRAHLSLQVPLWWSLLSNTVKALQMWQRHICFSINLKGHMCCSLTSSGFSWLFCTHLLELTQKSCALLYLKSLYTDWTVTNVSYCTEARLLSLPVKDKSICHMSEGKCLRSCLSHFTIPSSGL